MKKAILILFLLSCCSGNDRVVESADTTTTSTTTATTVPSKNLEIEKAYYACGLDSNTYYYYLEEENLITIKGTNPTSLRADSEKINNLCIFQYLKFPDFLITRLTSYLYLSNVQTVELENLQVSWFYNRYSGYTIGISDILGPGDKDAVEIEACSYIYNFQNFRASNWLDAHDDGIRELNRWARGDSFSEGERTIAQSKIQTFYDKKSILDNKLDPKKYSAEHPELTKVYDFLTGVAVDMVFVEVSLNSYLDGNKSNSVISLINSSWESYNTVADAYVAAHDEYFDSCN
jgi:hypothetical protein